MYLGKKIDYKILSDARDYYADSGYKETEVPWIVGEKAFKITAPLANEYYSTLGGYLVASGEQSFLEMIMNNRLEGKAFCITPCFRNEEVLDETHQKYFMKLELIDLNVSIQNLDKMISDAKYFFSKYTEVEVQKTEDRGESTYDIVDKLTGIELGSYGIRRTKDFAWIYGTGVALPRLTTIIDKRNV